MNFPTLYKKTQTGAMQRWDICITLGNKILTRWGQVDGAIQETIDTIKEGKNTGKKNATTPEQQAEKEAKARWDKQLKKGYVQDPIAAEAGQVDTEVIQGGIAPMLAHKYSEHADKLEYPAYASPKLDGHRCIAVVEHGKATLWSRTRKPVNSLPHIVKALEDLHLGEVLGINRIVLDGEAYVHSMRDDFETLTSILRKNQPAPGHEAIQYHIFDLEGDRPFSLRLKDMRDCLPATHPSIVLVEQVLLHSETEMWAKFQEYRDLGYEGLMLKHPSSVYEHKRSYQLLKVKEFEDAEFPIVGIEEGRGKLAGHAIFVCQTKESKRFSVKLKGSTERLKEIFENQSVYIGKPLTVRYQNMSADGLPRFPVGVAVRDYEDQDPKCKQCNDTGLYDACCRPHECPCGAYNRSHNT